MKGRQPGFLLPLPRFKRRLLTTAYGQTTVGFYHCAGGLFGEYHSSAALGKPHVGVTKQYLFGDWGSSNTQTSLMFKTLLGLNAEERSVAVV